MPLGGNGFAELAGFLRGLKKLTDASREIAVALAPKTSELVGETMAAQTSPTGEAWPATKDGSPAFGGSNALGYVLSRLSGKSSVRTTVLYPLHFHQDGTHAKGRKHQRKVRAKLRREGYSRAGIKGVVAQLEAGRKAGAYHDPPRPLIPGEGDPIPARWDETIRKTASEVMLKYGAVAR
jgi:hypothetical protein